MTDTQAEIFSDKVWKITVSTKYGTDVILVCQDEEPSASELQAIEERFQRDYDVEVSASTEAGYIDINHIPQGVNRYLTEESYG